MVILGEQAARNVQVAFKSRPGTVVFFIQAANTSVDANGSVSE